MPSAFGFLPLVSGVRMYLLFLRCKSVVSPIEDTQTVRKAARWPVQGLHSSSVLRNEEHFPFRRQRPKNFAALLKTVPSSPLTIWLLPVCASLSTVGRRSKKCSCLSKEIWSILSSRNFSATVCSDRWIIKPKVVLLTTLNHTGGATTAIPLAAAQ